MNTVMTPLTNQFAMLDHMPVGAFVLRQDFVALFWNRVLEDWTGFSRDEIVGHPISIHFPHLNSPKYAIRIQDVLTHGTPFIFSSYIHKYIIPVLLPDNQMQIQSTMVTRVPDPQTEDFYVLFSIQDVTELTHRIDGYRLMRDQAQKEIAERKHAEIRLKEGEERLRRVVENMPVLMVAFDADRNIIAWNRECERVTGYSADDVIQNPHALNLLFPHAPHRYRTLARLFRQNRKFYGLELEMAAKHGPSKVVAWSNTSGEFPIPGWTLWAIGVDVTERKRAEKAIQNARKAAEDANQAKSTFLANMSHELRTPLNVILGFSQLIARDQERDADEREYLHIIHRSGEHLLTLINQVLDLSKVEAGKMILHETNVDLVRMLDDVADLFRLRASEKGLELIFDCDPDIPRYVCIDEIKLRQVLINLLSNAMKFTSQGEVTMRVKSEKSRVNNEEAKYTHHSSLITLHFEIIDTGRGIAAEELPHVFEPFVQSAAGREAREGTGLGLPISQKFVRLMGDDLHVQSAPGKGSTFTFSIPIKSALSTTPAFQPLTRQVVGLAPSQPHYRVLVVDDNVESRQLLVELLAPLGFEIREVADGRDAVSVWEEWSPHLIWMDIRMPGLDGYAATQRIRQRAAEKEKACSPASHNPVIIAVTAGSFEDEQGDISASGCDDFLRKPYTDTEIFEMMHRHLDIEYVYEPFERDKNIASAAFTTPHCDMPAMPPDAGQAIPIELLEALEEATMTSDMTMMTVLIQQVRAYNHELADILDEWARNFEYLKILTWVQHLQAHARREDMRDTVPTAASSPVTAI